MILATLILGATLATPAELAKLQENVVPAIGQNAKDVIGDKNGNPRVLFVGNSITLHGPSTKIDWTNNFGMAASSLEKDYVHVLASRIRAKYPNATFGLLQVAGTIERSLGKVDLKNFTWVRDWKPDVITLFYGANVPREYDKNPTNQLFAASTEKVLNYIDPNHRAKVFHAQGFYMRPVLDNEKRQLAAKRGDTFVPMEDIGKRKDTHGRFNHPNDLGMQLIAERFWQYIEPVLAR